MQSLIYTIVHTKKSCGTLLVGMVLFCFFFRMPCHAQPEEFKPISFEILSIEFEGNKTFSDGDLEEVIETKESPGFISQGLYSVFGDKLGSKAEYFDETLIREDVKRIAQYYQNHSYFQVEVNVDYVLDTIAQSSRISFLINEGVSSLIESITYRGLDSLTDEVHGTIIRETILLKGEPYEPAKGQAEIVRILNVLAEEGYPQARYDKEKSGAFHHSASNNFELVFTFNPGRWFQFGDVTVHVEPPRDDITTELITRHLEFTTGEKYSRLKSISSEQSLNRLDLFETVRLEHPQFTDTLSSSIIPTDIYVRPRDRHEISPEIGVSDENNTFNLGLGIGYTNRNFFGDARLFTARARVRAQSLLEWNLGDVIFKGNGLSDPSVIGAVELQFQLQQPYLFSRHLTGTWTSSISSEKQKEFTLAILRNKIGLSNQFATYTYGLAEWTLERVRPELTSDTNKIPQAFTLEENKAQFNSILTLTLQRDKTNDIFSPTEGFFNSISLEESGVLPKVFPGLVDDSLFTQYYKIVLFGRWYTDLSDVKSSILAFKARAGFQEKYGESRSKNVNIPLNRRFFAGGSGSLRGWRTRDLGAMPDELLPLGGNFIIEGNIELRVNHFRGFGKLLWFELDNVWGVYFLDFGNVWNGAKDFRPSDIAASTGLGFRYETLFGPFRIDYGFRLYDPKEPPGHRTIFQKRFWAETFSNGILHFGIGHAF